MEVSSPVLLVKTPHSPLADGKIQVGPVWGIHGDVRRKRQEISVAVDGNSVNVYDVSNGHIVSSHPVPPLQSFPCPPCSVRSRDPGVPSRITYCALSGDTVSIRRYLEGKERSSQNHNEGSIELTSTSPPIHLDVRSLGGSLHVLALQRNGHLSIFSEDLQLTKSSYSLFTEADGECEVVASAWLTVAEAKKTVLKRRQDIVSSVSVNSSIVLAAYKSTLEDSERLSVGVWIVDSNQNARQTEHTFLGRSIRHTITNTLVKGSAGMHQQQSYAIASRGASLHIKATSGFIIYDITTLTPRLVSGGPPGVGFYHDSLVLSTDKIMSVFPDSLRIYDLSYHTIQVEKDLSGSALRKRKHGGDNESKGIIKLAAYFLQTGRIVAQRRNQLLAIDLKFGSSDRNRSRPSKSLLRDNIGYGFLTTNTLTKDNSDKNKPTQMPVGANSEEWKQWNDLCKQLEVHSLKTDPSDFEECFMTYVAAKQSNPDEFDLAILPDYQINFILGKMFELKVKEPGESQSSTRQVRLTLSLKCPELIQSLSDAGLLSRQRVLTAIAEKSKTKTPAGLPPDAIIEALIQADSSLALLCGFYYWRGSFDYHEKAAAIRLLLRRSRESHLNDDMGMDSGTIAHQNVSDTRPGAEQWIMSAAYEELPDTNSVPRSNLHNCTVSALHDFGRMPFSNVLEAMRTTFDQSDVLALVQFLRQQLFQAGHTTQINGVSGVVSSSKGISFLEDIHGQNSGSATVSLHATINLLRASVDLVGPLSAIHSVSEDERFLETIVADLCSEITRVVAGLEEAVHLRGVLRETLRYIDSLQSADAEMYPDDTNSGTPYQQKPGMIVTLFSESSDGANTETASAMLPLTLKSDKDISPIKVRKGGGQVSERSLREMGALEIRSKGAYSFERLVL